MLSLRLTKTVKMKRTILIALLLSGIVPQPHAQQGKQPVTVAFYNVENLFHPSKDSLKSDGDFTPDGTYHWSFYRYNKKISNIAKVLIALGAGSPPAIVGLAEIENEAVLKDLCHQSPLKRLGYRYIHYESPDSRGVDVALLYRDTCVTILDHRKIPVVFPFDTSSRNRDLLYVRANFGTPDSLHVIVNHWTSRYGGHAATIPKRNCYAVIARAFIDSILADEPSANILLMGDFNDYATDESMVSHLRAKKPDSRNTSDTLFNLMYCFEDGQNIGSHKHEDFWRCLDQIVVSHALLDETSGLHVKKRMPHIFQASFLLVPDNKYGGTKTYRTFSGPRYIGGFSDHLPVYVILEK